MTTAPVPNGDMTGVVSTAFALTSLGKGQLMDWTALPEMVVDRSPQVSDTRGSRLVSSNEGTGIISRRRRCKSDARIEV
jgi:hypothetical protein